MRVILLFMLASSAAFSSVCGERVIDALYERGLLPQFGDLHSFRAWRDRLPLYLGLSPEFVRDYDRKLAGSPGLLDLMAGYEVPGTWNRLQLSGGWGQDYLWAPLAPHWDRVQGNLGPLVHRMEAKLHLHPMLRRQMFAADLISLADSGWVVCEDKSGNDAKTGTVKVTLYDRHMTPDLPWPRYATTSIVDNQNVVTYRRPRPGDWPADEMLQTPYFYLKSSLDRWGLLPLETLTDFRAPEHDPAFYAPKHDLLFCENFFLAHKDLMENVLETFGTPMADYHLKRLMSFRQAMFPDEVFQIAELQRFHIPAGASKATRAHLFFGLTVLLHSKPVKTLYLLAPKPEDKNRPLNTYPRTEIAFIAPGFEHWRPILERAIASTDPAVEFHPDPKIDPLRDLYLELGFEIVKSYSHCQSTPNGCYIMRISREKLLASLVEYQRKNGRFLSGAQHTFLNTYFPK